MTRIPGDADEEIHIQELELSACVGVPDEERARPQRLTVSITLWPVAGFHEMEDKLEKTVDYASICRAVKEFVGGRNDKLIETLGDAIARHLLRMFPLRRVRLELRKFILPDVNYVAVSLTRER
jgi:dihydroneopterin aldolase